MARIIFDAVAVADGAHHFDVEHGALHDALRFDDFSLALELRLPPFELFVDALDGALALRGGQDVMRLRDKSVMREISPSRERISPVSGSILRMASIWLPHSSTRTAKSS